MTTKWESIRANWVNGNRADAKDGLYQLSKTRMLGTILEALMDYHGSTDNHNSNGSLTDLIEILKSIRCQK